jgi:hypothetical protein
MLLCKGRVLLLLNLGSQQQLYKLRNLASYFFFAALIIVGSYTLIQLGIQSFKNERASYNRKLARMDSLTKHCPLKEGILDSLVERTRLQKEPIYVYVVDIYIRLDSSDTLFAMNPSLAYKNRYLERHTPLKIRYVYDSVMAKAEVIELWIKERQVYSIAEHLNLHGPKNGLAVFTVVVGSFFSALAAFLVYVIFSEFDRGDEFEGKDKNPIYSNQENVSAAKNVIGSLPESASKNADCLLFNRRVAAYHGLCCS